MFDTAKVRRMTAELIKFAGERDNVWLILDTININVMILFRRLKMRVKAILSDVPIYLAKTPAEELWGLPVLKTPEAATNFNERTGIIILTEKPMPLIQTTFDFAVSGQPLKIPAFVMTPEEVLAIYDRLTIINIIQQYQADGLPSPAPKDLAARFARGLTTFLNPDSQNVKIRLWDRNYFVAPSYDVDDTAIVLRGQIVYENRYTEKTFEFYRETYPNAPIIVSTWKNELTDEFRTVCKKNSVVLLENIQPALPGFGHLNYQLENALKGVLYVKENLRTKYILVTRTDQRLNKFDFLLRFRNLIQTFPPLGDKLHGRIIIFGTLLTKKYLPFSITDFLMFGHVADIFKVYNIPPLRDATEFRARMIHWKTFLDMRRKLSRATFVKCDFAEHGAKLKKFNKIMNRFVNTDIFWLKNFYRNHIAPLDETRLLETWWRFMQQYLLLVDMDSVAFDWAKYEDHRRYCDEATGTDFSQWLELCRNFNVDWV